MTNSKNAVFQQKSYQHFPLPRPAVCICKRDGSSSRLADGAERRQRLVGIVDNQLYTAVKQLTFRP